MRAPWDRRRAAGIAVGGIAGAATRWAVLVSIDPTGGVPWTVLGVGGLGAFTTFSSFARDAVALGEQGQVGRAALYVAVTCAAGIGAASIGVALA